MTKVWKRQVGERLKALRLVRDYTTARQFAAALGVEENSYTAWERGTRAITPLDLAKILDLTGDISDYVYYGRTPGLPESLLLRQDPGPARKPSHNARHCRELRPQPQAQ